MTALWLLGLMGGMTETKDLPREVLRERARAAVSRLGFKLTKEVAEVVHPWEDQLSIYSEQIQVAVTRSDGRLLSIVRSVTPAPGSRPLPANVLEAMARSHLKKLGGPWSTWKRKSAATQQGRYLLSLATQVGSYSIEDADVLVSLRASDGALSMLSVPPPFSFSKPNVKVTRQQAERAALSRVRGAKLLNTRLAYVKPGGNVTSEAEAKRLSRARIMRLAYLIKTSFGEFRVDAETGKVLGTSVVMDRGPR